MRSLSLKPSFAALTLVSLSVNGSPPGDTVELPPYVVAATTGSHLIADPAVPGDAVRVFDARDLAAFGFTTPAELLQALPYTPGSGANPLNSWNDNGAQTTTNFRGLGDSHNLVLLNGRRAANFGQINGSTTAGDIGNLPAAGFASLLVLPDSASAAYGADAASGIIDLRLPSRVDSTTVRARVGNAFDTDVRLLGLEVVTGGTLGPRTNPGTWAAAAETRQRRGLLAADTRTGYTEDRRPFGGPDFRLALGWPATVVLPAGANAPASLIGVPISLGTLQPDGTVKVSPPSSNPQVADFVALPAPFTNGRPTPGDTVNQLDKAPYFSWLPHERTLGAWFMGEIPLASSPEAARAFVELIARRQHLRSTIHPFRINLLGEDKRGDGPGGAIVFPASNPYNPFGVDLLDVRSSMVEMGGRIRDYRNDSLRAVVGLRSPRGASPRSWEIAAGHHRHRTLEHGTNYSSDKLLQDALAGRLGGWMNPFGPSDPGVVERMRVPVRVDAISDMTFADAKLAGPLGERASWVVGAEARDERLQRIPDELLAIGAHAAWSRQIPIDLSRGTAAAFAEVSVRPASRLRAWASARHDRTDDFGSSTRPRFGTEWDAGGGWRLAATWGDAYKAPELVQLNASVIAFTGVITDPLRPELGPYEFQQRQGGNPDLKPETTTSVRLSASWRSPDGRRSAGIAAWRFHQRDAVTSVGPILLAERAAAGDPDAMARVTRAPNEADGRPGRVLAIDDVLGNYAGIRTQGADLWAQGELGTFADVAWRARVEGTWLGSWEYLPPDGPAIGLGGRVGFPRWRAIGILAGDRGDWSGSLAWRFLGPMRDPVVNYLGLDPDLGAHVTVDVGLARRLPALGATVSLTITNALDLRPPVSSSENRGAPPNLYSPVGRGFLLAIERSF